MDNLAAVEVIRCPDPCGSILIRRTLTMERVIDRQTASVELVDVTENDDNTVASATWLCKSCDRYVKIAI